MIEIINGHEVLFEPDSHQYFVDGILVPSVSQICKMDNPNIYQDVDPNVLLNAANRGTKLHSVIEAYETTGVIDESSQELLNYIKIKNRLKISKKHTEKMIIIKLDGKVVCAGRFDFLAEINGKKGLIDFKRTTQIHQEYVKLQLNLYALGLFQCYNESLEEMMVIRLRYSEIETIKVPIDHDWAIKKLKQYI